MMNYSTHRITASPVGPSASASPKKASPPPNKNSPSSFGALAAAAAAASLTHMASLTAHIESFDYHTHAAEFERRRQEAAQRVASQPILTAATRAVSAAASNADPSELQPPPLVYLPAESLAAYHGFDKGTVSGPAFEKRGPSKTKKTKTNPSKSGSKTNPSKLGSKRKVTTMPQLREGDRAPQRRFTDKGEERSNLFRSHKDQRIPLTTNTPRQVEAIDPTSKARVRLFASCSAASREMSINRTRMSRTCRSGGGTIRSGNNAKYFYRYVEIPASTTSTDNTTEEANNDSDESCYDTSHEIAVADARDEEEEEKDGSNTEGREEAVVLVAL